MEFSLSGIFLKISVNRVGTKWNSGEISRMSIKKGLFTALLVLLMLIPLAQLLRTQNPWNCFNFTFDESYFLQTASNWSEGAGYRTHEQIKPFDPLITVGIPMAWGAHAVQTVTHLDLGHAARTWIHLCFYFLLVLIAAAAYLRTRNWLAPLLALTIFSLGIRGIPYGSYFVYGFLGETPAIVLGTLSMIALDRKKVFIAGFLAVGAFILKPTFLLFLPAVGLAALINFRKRGILTSLAIGLSLVAYALFVAESRNQTLLTYLSDYSKTVLQVSLTFPGRSIFGYYEDAGWLPTLFTGAVLLSGFFAVLSFRRDPKNPEASKMAAAFLVATGIVYYLMKASRPVEKQWGAVLCMALTVSSIHWGAGIANRFRGVFSQEVVGTVFLAVIATWIINVPTALRHQFMNHPDMGCASKEQRYIGHELRTLFDQKKIVQKDLGVLISSPSFNLFIYELGWNPKYNEQWKDLGLPLPKVVVGQVDRLLPVPAGCVPEWMGDSFGMIRCGK